MIEPFLKKFLVDHVDPEKGVVEQATDSQQRMREILKDKLSNDDDFPSVLEGQDFLFGSAIRGTQAAPFDDIDLMLVLDGSALLCYEAGQVVGGAYGIQNNKNPLLLPQYLTDNGFVSSQKVLGRLRAILSKTYSRSDIRKDGQAINVWMDSYGFGVDVVPALKIASATRGDHYYIPMGTGSDMWQATNPHADLGAFEAADVRTNGFLRPTARLMRKWNELSNCGRLLGFHIDAMAYHALLGKDIRTLRDGLHACLGTFDTLLSSNCNQFTGYGHHIDHRLDSEDRRKSIAAIQSTRTPIFDLIRLGPFGTANQVHGAWNKMFAGKLPTSLDNSLSSYYE